MADFNNINFKNLDGTIEFCCTNSTKFIDSVLKFKEYLISINKFENVLKIYFFQGSRRLGYITDQLMSIDLMLEISFYVYNEIIYKYNVDDLLKRGLF